MVKINRWLGGVLGGLVGAAAFGVLMWALIPGWIGEEIPSLYGLDSALVFGGAIHLVHGVILGLVFAAVTGSDTIEGLVEREPLLSDLDPGVWMATAGIVYGLAIWVVLPAIVMPVWLEVTGFADAPPAPNLAIETLLGHVVYGVLLGGVYAMTVER